MKKRIEAIGEYRKIQKDLSQSIEVRNAAKEKADELAASVINEVKRKYF